MAAGPFVTSWACRFPIVLALWSRGGNARTPSVDVHVPNAECWLMRASGTSHDGCATELLLISSRASSSKWQRSLFPIESRHVPPPGEESFEWVITPDRDKTHGTVFPDGSRVGSCEPRTG